MVHFTLKELTDTNHAELQEDNRKVSPEVKANLEALIKNILDPLREALGKPIKVTSGYRCPKLNKKVGGQPTSQHQVGQAADLQGVGYTNAAIFKKIQELNLPFDQLIWEYGNKQEPAWIHVSYSSRRRKQILYIGVK